MELAAKKFEEERHTLKDKFQHSVRLLQELKQEQEEVERLRLEQASELVKVREELLETKRSEDTIKYKF